MSGQQHHLMSQHPPRDESPAGLLSIAEETLTEFLSKATETLLFSGSKCLVKAGPDSIRIVAISHGCIGVAARACGLVSLEPTRVAKILKDCPSWLRNCRAVDVLNVLPTTNGGTIELLYMQLYAPTTLAPGRDFWLLRYTSIMDDGSLVSKSSFQPRQRTKHILPKPPKPCPTAASNINKGTTSQTRVARPPAEGWGRSQLLPRYWPRITDQELQQLSGDLKSSIVPMFEKILSASDAGRIGRLVLPKACAEAYFPSINQSEGILIRIEDINGKHWTFQFRFWPNNNSRMYVLEGVTPCIQNMQLQAGDRDTSFCCCTSQYKRTSMAKATQKESG